MVLQDLGDYAQAKILFQKAVASDEKNFGEDHPTTACLLQQFGNSVLQDLGEYAQAKTLFQKALTSNEKNFGEDHPNTAIGYANLASVLQNLGDYAQAKTLLQKAVVSSMKKTLEKTTQILPEATTIWQAYYKI
jgi:tetratricopeptide (TPR) repeat protein